MSRYRIVISAIIEVDGTSLEDIQEAAETLKGITLPLPRGRDAELIDVTAEAVYLRSEQVH